MRLSMHTNTQSDTHAHTHTSTPRAHHRIKRPTQQAPIHLHLEKSPHNKHPPINPSTHPPTCFLRSLMILRRFFSRRSSGVSFRDCFYGVIGGVCRRYR